MIPQLTVLHTQRLLYGMYVVYVNAGHKLSVMLLSMFVLLLLAAATPSADAPGGLLPTPWETDSSISSTDTTTAAVSSCSIVMSRSSIAEAAAAAAPAVVHLVATAGAAAGAMSDGSTAGFSAWDGSR